MKIETIRQKRLKLRCSQSLLENVSGIRRARISACECGYSNATPYELKQLEIALNELSNKIVRLRIQGSRLVRTTSA